MYDRNKIYHSSRRFLDLETGNVYSLHELFIAWEENKQEIYLDSGASTFWGYLRNCTDGNGNLKEL